eukprot:PITA_10965
METVPKDVVRQCLLKVPYTSHDTLKTVCNSWEAMVRSPTFYADRNKCGTSEHLLCLIQNDMNERDMNPVFVVTIYDPVKGTWERLPPIDDPQTNGIQVWCQCVAVNRKLLLIGRIRPSDTSLMKSVDIYDFESARWSRGADMPTPRLYFACCVSSSTGLVYVAGGDGEHEPRLASVEAYNVETDKWEILPPMIEPHGFGCRSFFMDGKLMVLEEFERREVFDPSEGTWRMTEHEVEKYDVEKDVWSVVASFPNPLDIRFFTCVTQWRDQIFFSAFGALGKHISYLFNPSTREFTEVTADGGKLIISAATVEI